MNSSVAYTASQTDRCGWMGKWMGRWVFYFYLFIDIQHAPLHSNTTCFKIFTIQLHIFTTYVQFLLFSIVTACFHSVF